MKRFNKKELGRVGRSISTLFRSRIYIKSRFFKNLAGLLYLCDLHSKLGSWNHRQPESVGDDPKNPLRCTSSMDKITKRNEDNQASLSTGSSGHVILLRLDTIRAWRWFKLPMVNCDKHGLNEVIQAFLFDEQFISRFAIHDSNSKSPKYWDFILREVTTTFQFSTFSIRSSEDSYSHAMIRVFERAVLQRFKTAKVGC